MAIVGRLVCHNEETGPALEIRDSAIHEDPLLSMWVYWSADTHGSLVIEIDTHYTDDRPDIPLRVIINDDSVFHDVPGRGNPILQHIAEYIGGVQRSILECVS